MTLNCCFSEDSSIHGCDGIMLVVLGSFPFRYLFKGDGCHSSDLLAWLVK